MKILIIGSNGFIGSNVKKTLAATHEVYGAQRQPSHEPHTLQIDLTDSESIRSVLDTVHPEAIINCAGVIDAAQDVMLNISFTTNLLEVVAASDMPIKRIIITGSAGEYGLVDPADLPVKETAPLNANAGYGLSKLKETAAALELAEKHHLPVVIARVFNPVGSHMHPRFLISRILKQIEEIKAGTRERIEVGRLDAERDYTYITDVALAFQALIEGEPKETIYNVGSGVATSNGELIDLILKNSTLDTRPPIVETADQPEPIVASQADITRLRQEFNWSPQTPLAVAIKEIVNAYK